MPKNPTTLFFLAIVTIAVITTVKQVTKSKNCDAQAVINLTDVTLPYRTDTGTETSLSGIPRGKYQINGSPDISQIEVSAIVLDPSQNLIKTVLMVGGDFADDAEFELTDSWCVRWVAFHSTQPTSYSNKGVLLRQHNAPYISSQELDLHCHDSDYGSPFRMIEYPSPPFSNTLSIHNSFAERTGDNRYPM